jgi:hypothetical protein
MSRKIVGVTVGTPISPAAVERKLKPVKTVNGVKPDKNGNVDIDVDAEGGFGGYYTPKITQVDQMTAQVTFTPSDADMPPVTPAYIYLPEGPGGDPGENGVSPTVTVSTITGGRRINITDANGTKTFDVMDGKDGTSVEVERLEESAEDGGQNLVIFTDGTELNIRNGQKGNKGDKGDTGPAGEAGYTPQKGTDYFTPADKAEMVNAVIAALPVYNGEVVDV